MFNQSAGAIYNQYKNQIDYPFIHYNLTLSNLLAFKLLTSMKPEDQKPITCCNHILKLVDNEQNFGNLYLGSSNSLTLHVIKKFKISAVLSVMDEFMYKNQRVYEKISEMGVKQHKWINVEDDEEEEIEKYFQECYTYMEKSLEKYNLLVHCQGGISRSATIVISFIMKKLSLSLELANKFVVSKRCMISPNQSFWNSLQKYQKDLKAALAKPVNIILDPYSEFSSDKYHKKFANHILCVNNNGSLQKGNLFLGQLSILKPNFIESLKIKSVLSVVQESYYKRMKIKQTLQHLLIKSYLWIDIKDQPQENISKYYEQSYNFINENLKQGNVLVHCQQGVSRSASIVIAFIMKKFRVKYPVALKFVQSKRDVVKPNEGFELSLIEYSERVHEQQ